MAEAHVVIKPSRSDEVADADQQLKMAHQIRTHFDSLAPKRPQKPPRSEPSLPFSPPASPIQTIPELLNFRALQSQPHEAVWCFKDGGGDSSSADEEEFVETQYYSELNSIDNLHHTTGKGFISVAEGGGEGFFINLEDQTGTGAGHTLGFKSNPATNEWIPSMEEKAIFVSSKPNRSE